MSPLCLLAGLTACTLLACTSAARREVPAQASAAEVAAEVSRICLLPPVERQAALEKLKAESAMVLFCGARQ